MLCLVRALYIDVLLVLQIKESRLAFFLFVFFFKQKTAYEI